MVLRSGQLKKTTPFSPGFKGPFAPLRANTYSDPSCRLRTPNTHGGPGQGGAGAHGRSPPTIMIPVGTPNCHFFPRKRAVFAFSEIVGAGRARFAAQSRVPGAFRKWPWSAFVEKTTPFFSKKKGPVALVWPHHGFWAASPRS